MPDAPAGPPGPGGPAWHALTDQETAERLATGPLGLTAAEAAERLRRTGPNSLPEPSRPSLAGLLLHQLTSPLVLILLVAAVISLLLGERVDAAVIGVVLVLNSAIGAVQEHRADSALQALFRLAAPQARVIRDGREHEVAGRDLVPGDLVVLDSGSRVPADLRVAAARALLVDQSLLTGEAVPVAKSPAPVDPAALVADRSSLLHAGTLVRSGRGRGYVVATGTATELGAIAETVRTEPRAKPPLERQLTQLGRVIGIGVVVAAALAFQLGVASGERAATMFLVAVALAVSAVPEGLPIASTVTLALGLRRMARRQVIVRRLAAVETLGSTTVIGTDKTGTLTENRMTVTAIRAGGRLVQLPEMGGTETPDGPVRAAALAGVLTNDAEIYQTDRGWESHGDPTEAALLMGAAALGIEPEVVRAEWETETETPFEPELRYSASIRLRAGRRVLYVKGAPDRIVAMCDRIELDQGPGPLDQDGALEAAAAMAADGLRVIATASRPVAPEEKSEAVLARPAGLTLLGLHGMADPPRRGVAQAIAACRTAGVRVVMITGDHEATASAIGRAIGLLEPGAAVVTGRELQRMTPEELNHAVRSTAVFARVDPGNKLAIVRALQAQGETVAVTGDGVNDGPALKAAEVGVAMGRSGTDVAREAADIVLTNDDFVSLVAALEQGRVTFDNIRKVTFYLLSTNAAEVAALLAAVAAGWPLPLLATQLLWLNLATEGLQHVALAFEPGEPQVLERPPRRRGEGILSGRLWERTILAGLVQAGGTLALFRWALGQGVSLASAQAVALATLVVFETLQVGNSRSERRSVFAVSPFSNPFLFIATAAAFGLNLLMLAVPAFRGILGLGPVPAGAWWRIGVVGLAIIVAMELHKLLRPSGAPSPARLAGEQPVPARPSPD